MAAPALFSVEFPVGCPSPCDPPPQLVMLATVAAAEGLTDSGAPNQKEMMELQTVGSDLLDSEEESSIRYSYDNQSQREVCIIEYPASPAPGVQPVVLGQDKDEEVQDLSQRRGMRPSASSDPQGAAVAAEDNGRKRRKPFHCKPCNFQAQSESELVQHLRTHAASKMKVVTSVEGSGVALVKEAESAGEIKDGGDAVGAGDSKGLIRCERCGYNTNRYDHYIAHLKHHSKEGQDPRVFKCTLCTYTTVSQYHWRKHLRNHFPSKLHTCSQCSYFSDRKSNYIQHIRTHTGVRPFQCPYCDYSSSQKTHLTRHKRTHSGERPFKCESCNYLAANQHEVTRHARQVHNGPKPLGCPFCEYRTADRSNYKKHVELHLKPRQFLCPLCKYAASKKCNLQYHIKSRHSGCDVPLDVSKVKLRVKKPRSSEVPDKSDNSSGVDEELDVDDLDSAITANKANSPINLSLTSSSQSKDGLKKSSAREKKTLRPKKSAEEKRETRNQRKTKKKTADTQKHQSEMDRGQEKEPDDQVAGDESESKEVRRMERKVNKNRKSHPKKVQEKIPGKHDAQEEPPTENRTEKVLDLSPESKVPSKRRRLTSPEIPPPMPQSTQQRTRKSNRKLATCQQDEVGPSLDREAPPVETANSSDFVSSMEEEPDLETSAGPCNEQSPGGTDPSLSEDPPTPTFAVPTSPASLGLPAQRRKPTEAEEDEGIHSSHEGASDISDSASEGSDDSGLHSNATVSSKMANDPETPTDEIPTPTELKSHLCIFCDRTFPLEAAYRRHLNRHLVNVYYLDASKQ
ncbi:RE1-silencing transcription factor [Synchiropus splendidus]|uniref:RE1-silencing transcription factor n=1 Tax=Synchiropus splendidus TaxID=270530 RepID=UPI00237E1536|nr:RE1-silencing transcription factor [Synchiropus splendidus]